MNYFWFWFIMTVLLGVMVVLALGGGLWGAERSIGHWTGTLFQNVCHQDPARSFTFLDVPMAVNSRCFGIFSGLWIGWLFIPVLISLKTKKNWTIPLLLFAVIVQIIDYTGNLFQFWVNTNISRAALGLLLGVAASFAVFELFKQDN